MVIYQLLQWQHRGVLSGVGIVVVSKLVTNLMKRLSVGTTWIHLLLADVSMVP